MRIWLLAAVLGLGCNAVMGLDEVHGLDAATTDGSGATGDASSGATDGADPDGGTAARDAVEAIDAAPDACVPVSDGNPCTADTCGNPPLNPGTPCAGGVCDGAGACVACVRDLDCGAGAPGACVIPVCIDHACTSGPAPRDRLCNGDQDQCDGAGHCVDCTNNGGCGECCACFSQTCQPV